MIENMEISCRFAVIYILLILKVFTEGISAKKVIHNFNKLHVKFEKSEMELKKIIIIRINGAKV